MAFRASVVLHRRKLNGKQKYAWGSPGEPVMRLIDAKVIKALRFQTLAVTPTHYRADTHKMVAYLGKHVPHSQKSLWSPDTPVPQDQYRFMLTTIDIDAFKYWFGVKRAMVTPGFAKLMWRAGLLPPSTMQYNPLLPKPVFDKEELYAYWLKNRPPAEKSEKDDYHHYVNSMPRTEEQLASDTPKAPWL